MSASDSATAFQARLVKYIVPKTILQIHAAVPLVVSVVLTLVIAGMACDAPGSTPTPALHQVIQTEAADWEAENCDPSYSTVCIPPYPPDLDCGEIPHRRFTVVSPDPHGFDRDRDGIGCERN